MGTVDGKIQIVKLNAKLNSKTFFSQFLIKIPSLFMKNIFVLFYFIGWGACFSLESEGLRDDNLIYLLYFYMQGLGGSKYEP